jgi:hypothetical protein
MMYDLHFKYSNCPPHARPPVRCIAAPLTAHTRAAGRSPPARTPPTLPLSQTPTRASSRPRPRGRQRPSRPLLPGRRPCPPATTRPYPGAVPSRPCASSHLLLWRHPPNMALLFISFFLSGALNGATVEVQLKSHVTCSTECAQDIWSYDIVGSIFLFLIVRMS